jgi:hypothetical protein
MRSSSIKFAVIVAIAPLVPSSPVLAQDGAAAGVISSQQDEYELGMCLAQNRRGKAEAFLATFPFSRRAQEAAQGLKTPECLIRGEMFNSEAVRGALYQVLYRIDFGQHPAADLSKAPQLDYSAGIEATDGADVYVNLRRYGDCVVRQDPATARRLTLSGMGSAEESLAFMQLKPAMGACLVPGHSLSFKRPMLKSVVAETLYRLTAAASGRPALADRK